MNELSNINNFNDFKNYITTTDNKVVFVDSKSSGKNTFIDKIKNLFKPAVDKQRRTRIESEVKSFLIEGISQKLQKDKEKVESFLPRILRICKVSEEQLSDVSSVKKVLDAIDRLEWAGQAPQFYATEPKMIDKQHAKNMIKYLFSDQPLSMKLVNSTIVKALLITKNKELLEEIRIELDKYLEKLAIDLNKPEFKGAHEQKLGEILIGNILALYPFFEPKNGIPVKIPQKIDNHWELMDYRVNLVPMTPDWKGDPYYACGFRPENKEGQPYLSFMGTPPLTTRGALHAELTDFVPGRSVGETLYGEGKKAIEDWVNEVAPLETDKKIDVFGQSLGGSLSLILSSNLPKQVGKVFAYNPPSLWQSQFDQYQTNVKDLKKKPEINIFCQENDPVYSLGAGWDPEWNVYQVLPEEALNIYEAHIRAFSSHNVVVLKLTKEDIQTHNASVARRIYNIVMEIIRVPLFISKTISLQVQIIKINAPAFVKKIRDCAMLLLFGARRLEPVVK